MGYWGRTGYNYGQRSGQAWHAGAYAAPSAYSRSQSSRAEGLETWFPRDTKRGQDVLRHLREIEVEDGTHLSLRESQPSSWTRSSQDWERIQDSRQSAAKLKCIKTLASLSDTPDERRFYLNMASNLNAESASALPPDQRLKQATQELAEARAKQERAMRHLKEAQEQLDKSTELLSYSTAQHEAARVAVQESQARRTPPPPPPRPPSPTTPTSASTASAPSGEQVAAGVLQFCIDRFQRSGDTVSLSKKDAENMMARLQATLSSPDIPKEENMTCGGDRYETASIDSPDPDTLAQEGKTLRRMLHPTSGRRRNAKVKSSFRK